MKIIFQIRKLYNLKSIFDLSKNVVDYHIILSGKETDYF